MPTSHEKALKRARTESDAHISRSRVSCDESERQMHFSRAAIYRSLELLRQRFTAGMGPDER